MHGAFVTVEQGIKLRTAEIHKTNIVTSNRAYVLGSSTSTSTDRSSLPHTRREKEKKNLFSIPGKKKHQTPR